MGYETSHYLTHDLTDDEKEIFIKKYEEHYGKKGGLSEYELEELLDDNYVCTKWYNNRDEMKFMSKFFPDSEFLLEGNGDESDDFWKEYYKNGKHQFCQGRVVFDEPNENNWIE